MKLVELLPWTEFLDVHLKKDPGLFPIYISKYYNIPYEIVYIKSNNNSTKVTDLPNNGKIIGLKPIQKKRITKLTDIRRIFFLLPLIIYIIKNRKSISHYLLFHATDNSLTLAFFIKLFSPKAKIWLKMDANHKGLTDFISLINKNTSIKQKILSKRYKNLIKKIDLISVETKNCFDILKTNNFFSHININLIPNGIENDLSDSNLIKENIITSVARFGNSSKNSELLLNALSQLDLKDWEVYLIGPIEKEEQDFQLFINEYFNTHPNLKNKIVFTGNITDKKELNEYYMKSKVFVLPSKYESFGIAPLEAISKGNYLILSDVGAARDFIINDNFGFILPASKQGEQNLQIMEKALIIQLQKIINREIRISNNINNRINYFRSFSIENIIKQESIKNFIIN